VAVGAARQPLPNKRLKLAGADRHPLALRRRAGRPQLKGDPVGRTEWQRTDDAFQYRRRTFRRGNATGIECGQYLASGKEVECC
jgi:hypothetical protein